MTKPSLDSWPEIVAECEEEIKELRLELERLRTPWRVQLDSYRAKNKSLHTENSALRSYLGVQYGLDLAHSIVENTRLRALNAELIGFVELYDRTYASTQTHPSIIDEAACIAQARAILAKAKEQP